MCVLCRVCPMRVFAYRCATVVLLLCYRCATDVLCFALRLGVGGGRELVHGDIISGKLKITVRASSIISKLHDCIMRAQMGSIYLACSLIYSSKNQDERLMATRMVFLSTEACHLTGEPSISPLPSEVSIFSVVD